MDNLNGAHEGGSLPGPPVLVADRTESALSSGQEQLWFLDQLSPGETTYTIPLAYRLRGRLDVEALRRSLTLLVGRHEALRASFGARDGTPFQTIAPPGDVALDVSDLADLDRRDREAAVAAAVQAGAAEAFDLESGPLYRFRLLRVAPDDHVLCLGFHHIVTDGWSSGIMNRDLAAAYGALVTGREPDLGPPAASYLEYVAGQRERLHGVALDEELDYWEHYLARLPVVELPSSRVRPATPDHRGASLVIDLPDELLAVLRGFAQERGVSLFMLLSAATSLVLSRYTGQEDIPLGVTMLGRTEPELEDVVGLFVNMVVMRADLSGDPSFTDLLGRVADANLELYDHQEVPFEKVVERVQPVRELGRNPLFQVAVQLLGDGNSGGSLQLPGIAVEPIPVASTQARFDLTINFLESAQRLQAGVEYASGLFERWWIEAMIGHVVQVLTAVCRDPALRVSQVPLLAPVEREALLAAGRGEQVDEAREPAHVVVARVAATAPRAVAAVCRGQELTYGELDRRAGLVARFLRSRGVRHEQVVAIVMDRDLDTLVAILGVLKAGAAFAMMDPAHPEARLDFMIRDTAAPVVITRSPFVGRLPEPSGWTRLVLDTDWDSIEARAAEPLAEWATGDSLAYVLYTSGSTGKPKGVLIEHRALMCFIEAYRRTFDFGPHDRMLQLPALTFDMSQGEIFTALSVGAALVMVSPEEGLAPDALSALMREQRVTYAGLSPAMLSVVEPGPYPYLRCVMGGADALPAELVNKWNLPGRRFVNLYGPTEAAIACTEYECEHVVWQSSPPIGRPELNRRVYVVDRWDNLVPKGVPGELLIGGDEGLARGYLNQPELTAEKFVPDPFHPGGRVYRSGDLVRWTRDEQIDFLGRIDGQVKLRGLRIELGEVESALLTHPAVRMATVLLRPDRRGEQQLVGYFTSVGPQPASEDELRRHLGKALPEYMVPTAWVALDEFPLTAARKIDRAALPAPDRTAADSVRRFIPPATPAEATVAEIFAEVLSLPRVGADENFFELGGNSLQAMRAVSRINKAFGVKVTIRMLYGTTTVRAISEKIAGLPAAQARTQP
jgi:amino acid adenylation domain-containing protein